MKSTLLICILFCLSCTSTIDSAGDRADITVDKAVARLEAAESRMVKDALDQTRQAVKNEITSAKDGIVRGTNELVQGAESRITNTVTGRMSPDDRNQFNRDVKDRGWFEALKAWWVEILFGSGATAQWIRSHLKIKHVTKDKEKAEKVADTVIQGVDKANAQDVREHVEECLRGSEDEYELRRYIKDRRVSMARKLTNGDFK